MGRIFGFSFTMSFVISLIIVCCRGLEPYNTNLYSTLTEITILALTEVLTVLKEPCNIKFMTCTGDYFKGVGMSLVFKIIPMSL